MEGLSPKHAQENNNKTAVSPASKKNALIIELGIEYIFNMY